MKSIMHEMEERVLYMTLGGLDFESNGEGFFYNICNCSRYYENCTSLHDVTLMLIQL